VTSCKQHISFRSKRPRSPSHSLGTPYSHCSSSPSTSRSQLCKAQQVSHILSALRMLCNQIPVLSILHLPFTIPKVHSTSFRIDSIHSDHRISRRSTEVFNEDTVVAHDKYPLSTINHTPFYFLVLISPCALRSNNSNTTSLSILPSKMPCANLLYSTQGSTVTPLALLFLDSTVGCKSILLLLAK
jgi:hypothetical protein